jgi:hypothetical protein
VEPVPVQLVEPVDDLPVLVEERAHVLQGADLVVAPGEHLQQRFGAAAAREHPGTEQADDRFCLRHHQRHPLLAVGASGSASRCLRCSRTAA